MENKHFTVPSKGLYQCIITGQYQGEPIYNMEAIEAEDAKDAYEKNLVILAQKIGEIKLRQIVITRWT